MINSLTDWAAAFGLIIAILMLVNWLSPATIDDSDLPATIDDSDLDADHRSGLRVYTDYKTGIQYLGQRSGGLVPRLNADGSVMRVEARR